MRLRIALSLAVLVFLVILTLSLALVFLLHQKEEEFIDNQLADQIEYSMAIWRKSPEAAFPNTPAMWLYRVGKEETADQAGFFKARACAEIQGHFFSKAIGAVEVAAMLGHAPTAASTSSPA